MACEPEGPSWTTPNPVEWVPARGWIPPDTPPLWTWAGPCHWNVRLFKSLLPDLFVERVLGIAAQRTRKDGSLENKQSTSPSYVGRIPGDSLPRGWEDGRQPVGQNTLQPRTVGIVHQTVAKHTLAFVDPKLDHSLRTVMVVSVGL